MSILEINTTSNFQFLEENHNSIRGAVLVGGTRSSKTIAALQWILKYCLSNTGKEIVICRDTLTNLKRTTLKDFQAICYGFNEFDAMYPTLNINKSDLTCVVNGNNISFIGLLDDPMRVYGLYSDLFYINEAVSTYKHTFNQLNQRCSEFWILDCNPSEPNSWVYQLDQREDVETFRTTYEDNPFLPSAIVKEIEGYEPTPKNIESGTADERMWSIYGKGLVFKGKEIIYPNWTTYDEPITDYELVFFGLDWGYNHPLACIKVTQKGNNIYLEEVMYKSEVDEIEDIANVLHRQPEIIDGSTYVVCDSSEPRNVNKLVSLGIPAMKVKKGANTVIDGIRKVKGYKMHVHSESVNLQKELNNYKWKVDKATGNVLDVPIKLYDDGLDAVRYVIWTFL